MGLHTFIGHYPAATNNNGVDTEKEVTVALINGVRVRFISETRFRGGGTRAMGGGRRAVRSLTDVDIEWEEWKGKARWIRIIQTLHRAMT